MVREQLSGGARSFGQLWVAVERAGGTKFALKSALGKGRERGEFHYDGEVYSAHPPKKKALPVHTRKASNNGQAAASAS